MDGAQPFLNYTIIRPELDTKQVKKKFVDDDEFDGNLVQTGIISKSLADLNVNDVVFSIKSEKYAKI